MAATEQTFPQVLMIRALQSAALEPASEPSTVLATALVERLGVAEFRRAVLMPAAYGLLPSLARKDVDLRACAMALARLDALIDAHAPAVHARPLH